MRNYRLFKWLICLLVCSNTLNLYADDATVRRMLVLESVQTAAISPDEPGPELHTLERTDYSEDVEKRVHLGTTIVFRGFMDGCLWRKRFLSVGLAAIASGGSKVAMSYAEESSCYSKECGRVIVFDRDGRTVYVDDKPENEDDTLEVKQLEIAKDGNFLLYTYPSQMIGYNFVSQKKWKKKILIGEGKRGPYFDAVPSIQNDKVILTWSGTDGSKYKIEKLSFDGVSLGIEEDHLKQDLGQ